jgi:hypothetical protein
MTQVNHSTFSCEKCLYKCSKQSEWVRHISTQKHIDDKKNATIVTQKAPQQFTCPNCSKHYSYRQGLSLHRKKCAATTFTCNCGKNYSTRSGLWKHHKADACIMHIAANPVTTTPIDSSLIDALIKENAEFKNVLIDVVKSNAEFQKQIMTEMHNHYERPPPVTINNSSHMHNSNNKTFNLQFFLNEECKDAMNIMDFVDSFSLQLSDLESVGKLGYVEGMSKIIINKLNELEVHKRPIHCSDAKRDIMHIKDNNRWEKESADNARIRRAIKYISKKNSNLLVEWSDAHPGSKHINDKANDDYMQLIVQAMGGSGDMNGNENKIIKKIAKEVLIDKII